MLLNKLKSTPVLIICCLILALVMSGCNTDRSEENTSNDNEEVTADAEATLSANTAGDLQQLEAPSAGEEILVFKTNRGEIRARLFAEVVPETHKNFVFHVEENNYDGTIFHRVIEGFMIQGGDIDHMDGRGGYSYKGEGTTIAEEFHPDLRHHRGALSMAKTAFPATTGSQFFIVHADAGTPHLDGAHSVFGQVFEGMDIVDAIAGTEVGANDKPVEDVVLEDVYLEIFES